MRELFSLIYQLSAVGRFSRDHMVKRESVLEHIGFCVVFAYYFALRVQRLTGVKVDIALLLSRIVAHDIDEAMTGDIPRVTKYWTPEVKRTFDAVERDAVRWIERLLNTPLFDLWASAKANDVEGCVMKLTDIAAVVFKVWAEVVLHRNMAFMRVAKEVQGFLHELMSKLKDAELPPNVDTLMIEAGLELSELNLIACAFDDNNGLQLPV